MRTHTRLFLGALTAALVLANAVGTASANRLSLSNKNFRLTWSPISLVSSEEGSGLKIGCNVTLEGSFHYNTFVKVRGALVGYVTKSNVAHPCSGSGEVWFHNGIESAGLGIISNNLPWHLTYEGFEGALPAIGGVRLLFTLLYTFRSLFTGLCVYFGNAEGVMKLSRSGVATNVAPDAAVGIPRSGGGGFCPAAQFFTATAERSTITLLGNTTLVTLTLI